ncbi:cobalt ECF transporter T component CbiQ [Actinomycetota bacterium]|nr:cobalt ECF transporter T component CbiQ [Micrococcales bacterium]
MRIDEAAWASPWRHRATGDKALLALGMLLVAALSTSRTVSVLVLALAAGVALVVARIPARTWLSALSAPAAFVAVGSVALAVTIGADAADTLASVGAVDITRSGVAQAVSASLRSFAAMACLVLLAATTPMTDLLAWLRRLRVPEAMVDIAGLVYRMLFALLDASRSVREAQAARLGYRSGRMARRSIGMLLGAVLLRAWTRARRLEDGLAGRGYTTSLRTLPRQAETSPAFVGISALVLSGLVSLSVSAALRGWP